MHIRPVRGFTLIEILVVLGIIAILAAIVIIAINPARQFAQGRDTQRVSNLNSILNAIGQKMADNKGIFNVGTCPALPAAFATTSVNFGAGTGIDLSCLAPTYISSLPIDPAGTTTVNATGYYMVVDNNQRVHVVSLTQEQSIPRTAYIEVVR